MMLRKEREDGFDEGKLEGIEEGIKRGIKKGKLEGIKEGMERGIKENSYSIAKNLKKSGLDTKFISENTGLSIDEINKL